MDNLDIENKLRFYKRSFFALFGLVILFLSLIFTPLTNQLYAFIEVRPSIHKADAIILLSGGQYTNDLLHGDTYHRLYQARKLYQMGYADKIIIPGGILMKGHPPISETMKDVLVDLGVDGDKILTESTSQNTYENIKNILPLLHRQNILSSLLVTSSYHMLRSMAVCRKLGIRPYPAGVPCYEKEISGFQTRSRFVFNILREYGAIVYFRIRGWA